MRTNVYYSITNGGDGSAGIALMESRELAELDQEIENASGEGFAEDCSGWISIEHDGELEILDEIETVDSMIEEIVDDYEGVYEKGHEYYPNEKMAALVKFKEQQDGKITATLDSIVSAGVDADTATKIVQAIANGEIKNVSFQN